MLGNDTKANSTNWRSILKSITVAALLLALMACGGHAAFTPAASAQAQPSQTCTPATPAAVYNSDSSVTIDMGTCVLMQGTSSAFVYDQDFTVFFGDVFRSRPGLIFDYATPDSFNSSFTVWLCDNTCTQQLTTPVTITANSAGEQVFPLVINFQPGMKMRIVEHVDVQDSVSQCFQMGYYCYFGAKFTLR